MFVNFLINAAIGAFIGFITNYLAIKMLFKPLKPVYIGKIRVPFTPGIIPKEKIRLAKSIGTVVGNKLLTGDVLEKALRDEDIATAMNKLIGDAVSRQEESQSSIRDMLAPVIKDEEKIDDIVCVAVGRFIKTMVRSEDTKSAIKKLLSGAIGEFMSTSVKSLDDEIRFSDWAHKAISFLISLINNEGFIEKLELQVVHFMERESDNALPLSSYLPDPFFDSVKNAVSNNADRIGGMMTGLLDNPQIEKNVLEILNGLMDTNVTTRVINVFVSKDAIYKRIKQKIEKYVSSGKGKQELALAINKHVNKLKTTGVGDIIKHANREDVCQILGSMIRLAVRHCLDAKFDELLSNQIGKYLSDNPDITLGKLLEPLLKGESDCDKLVGDAVEFIVRSHADRWIDEIVRMAVPGLLDQKIARFATCLSGYGKNLGRSISGILFSFIVPRAGEIINAMNITKLITDKVNEYDIDEMEEIILSIINRELRVIILLGAVFGFIIGLVGPLISGLVM